jgi:signal peptidase II
MSDTAVDRTTRHRWRRLVSGTLAAVALLGGPVARQELSDRALDGKIADRFHTRWRATVNLADTYITCGVVMLIALLLRDSTRTPAESRST